MITHTIARIVQPVGEIIDPYFLIRVKEYCDRCAQNGFEIVSVSFTDNPLRELHHRGLEAWIVMRQRLRQPSWWTRYKQAWRRAFRP